MRVRFTIFFATGIDNTKFDLYKEKAPTAVFWKPMVLLFKELLPIEVFWDPVVLKLKEAKPIPTLLFPVELAVKV